MSCKCNGDESKYFDYEELGCIDKKTSVTYILDKSNNCVDKCKLYSDVGISQFLMELILMIVLLEK
jgi:hypothetical protein